MSASQLAALTCVRRRAIRVGWRCFGTWPIFRLSLCLWQSQTEYCEDTLLGF
jgi:hypothetical protein